MRGNSGRLRVQPLAALQYLGRGDKRAHAEDLIRAMVTDAMRPWLVQVIGLLIVVAAVASGVGLFALSTCEHG